MSFSKIFAMFHRGASRFPLLEPNPGYNPVMVQRPLIGAGDTGRYALDGFQVGFNSPVGGGTLPLGNAPGLPRGALAVTPQVTVEYGGMGSIPITPGSGGLVPGFRFGGSL